MVESSSGHWGPIEVAERIGSNTLRLQTNVPSGSNLDYVIRRLNIIDETFSIHADGARGPAPRRSTWEGGSNGDPLFRNVVSNTAGVYVGDLFRSSRPPLWLSIMDRYRPGTTCL